MEWLSGGCAVFPDEELMDRRSVIIQFDGDPAADDEKLSKLTEDERLHFTGLLMFLSQFSTSSGLICPVVVHCLGIEPYSALSMCQTWQVCSCLGLGPTSLWPQACHRGIDEVMLQLLPAECYVNALILER